MRIERRGRLSNRARHFKWVVVAVAVVAVGCGDSNQPPRSPELPSPVTFTSPEPVQGRWNRDNDFTAYEPCTAINSTLLTGFGVDPKTWRDVSMNEGPRGCRAVSDSATFTALVLNATPREFYDNWYAAQRADFSTQRGVTLIGLPKLGVCVVAVPTSSASSAFFSLAAPSIRESGCVNFSSELRETVESLAGDAQTERRHRFALKEYATLLQLGRISTLTSAPLNGPPLLDDQRRLRPYSEWRVEYEESWARWTAGMFDLLRAMTPG